MAEARPKEKAVRTDSNPSHSSYSSSDMAPITPPVDEEAGCFKFLVPHKRNSRKGSLLHNNPTLLDHIIGTFYGNCAGDAIGLLTEFMDREEAHRNYGKYKNLEYKHKIPDMHRYRWETGDWTDDSDQMILIMQSLTENNGKIDPKDYGGRIKVWMKRGFQELGDFGGMGIGATTMAVLTHPKFQDNPHEAAADVWEKSGRYAAPNGAVMRTAILGIHDFKNIKNVIKNTLDVCKTTHADPRCQASCVAVTTAIAMMLQKEEKHMTSKGIMDIEAIIADSFDYAKVHLEIQEQIEELHFHINVKTLRALNLTEEKKIGYTFKCLGCGFWALRQRNFRQAIQAILMEAGDADTNCAVAGALLGCRVGMQNLPQTWISGFRHKKWLDEQISKYFTVLDNTLGNSAETLLLTAFKDYLATCPFVSDDDTRGKIAIEVEFASTSSRGSVDFSSDYTMNNRNKDNKKRRGSAIIIRKPEIKITNDQGVS
ncbi:ADP-ribosylarginine hydrolase Tri1-like [Lineus longissimus]|uniref:ADP-ribosylarginine hydrolase Tri1-like n=1 Tax=Lineus longissimus TaxID=88925 RepID=UPI00315D9F00